jgi:hydrogenase maturation factor
MCLALVGTVVEVAGKSALVDFEGVRRKVNAEFIRPKPGERVVVFNDFIIEKAEE